MEEVVCFQIPEMPEACIVFQGRLVESASLLAANSKTQNYTRFSVWYWPICLDEWHREVIHNVRPAGHIRTATRPHVALDVQEDKRLFKNYSTKIKSAVFHKSRN